MLVRHAIAPLHDQASGHSHGAGLCNMKVRVERAGGSLTITSRRETSTLPHPFYSD